MQQEQHAPKIDVYLDEKQALQAILDEVERGLSGSPRRLPSKLFYDERGSLLFEEITEQPEYYLTRAEMSLLEQVADEVAVRTKPRELIELGAGSAKKTELLIEACRRRGALERYLPVDVSEEMARDTALRLSRRYPKLEIHGVVGDFEQHIPRIPAGERPLMALLGSTLGNFSAPNAVKLLSHIPAVIGSEGYLLLGTDLVKSVDRLEAAYNDDAGVTAQFNRNILDVLNAQLGADFDADAFEHVSHYNEDTARMETSLRAAKDQQVRVDDLDLEFEVAAGEKIHTEVSCKYTRESLSDLVSEAGMKLVEWFADEAGDYALSLSVVR